MTITAVSSLNSNATAASANAAAAANNTGGLSSTLNMNFSTYLKILTTQLKNQDPTNATDPNQFTQELVQMAGVQQQISTNQNLNKLVTAQSSNTLSTGLNYIGGYVQANSTSGEFPLQNGTSEFGYSLSGGANTALITVQNAQGNAVATLKGGTAAGGNYVTWDGKDANGNQLPDGAYTFAVAATDANGNKITSSDPVALFRVTSVQSNSDGTLQLLAGNLSLSTSDVTNVYAPSSMPSATAGAATTTG